MLNLTRPRYVMPVHGDFKRHAAARRSWPRPSASRGEHLPHRERHAAGDRRARARGSASARQAGMIFVDGVDIGDVADVALRDRRMLSADGIFIIVATVSEQDGSSVVPPEVLARGVPFLDGDTRLHRRAARGGRGLARPRRRAARSPRSTCWSASCTTTSRASSTTGSSAVRWCCRSSSRCEPARAARSRGGPAQREQHERHDPRAGHGERGARGGEAGDHAAEQEPDAGHAPRRATRAGRTRAPGTPAAWPSAARSSPPPTGCRCPRRRRPDIRQASSSVLAADMPR